MLPEAKATEEVRLAAPLHNSRIFRNNSGGCVDETGRMIRFGLGNDGSKASKELKFGDYVGFTSILITPDMVGQTIAVFTNLEIKPDGDMQKTLTKACSLGTREHFQWKTCEFVKSFGGLAGFVTNKDDVKQVLTWKNK